ncbi:MAG: proline--tRNA ligase [Pseudomonadota bacterium]
MRLSQYYLPVLKETPTEAAIASHQLMLRAGMIRQTSAGIYAWLPLGLKVLKKIETIVRSEMNRAGAVEVLMPTIQSAELWRQSGRYDDYGEEMLRIQDRQGRDMLFGPTNEEMITDLFKRDVRSYKDLPLNLYHIQWKFRDEVRPRFGVMRGREFSMKDAYSFDLDEASARASYDAMFAAYLRTFARLGLRAVPVRADTGPIGGDLSHEFHILAETGESALFYDQALEAITADQMRDVMPGDDVIETLQNIYAMEEGQHTPEDCPIDDAHLRTKRGIEVGHIFFFGTKYSEAMDAKVQGQDGSEIPVQMGSYGIGVSRLVGGIIEASHDDNGIIWPASVSPFDVGLINLRAGDDATDSACEALEGKLRAAGKDVLYDDRDERAGAKFAAMDLIGLPYQVTVGPRGLKEGIFEVKDRASGAKQSLSPDETLGYLTQSTPA